MAPRFKLGARVRDRHSGAEGTIYMIETCLYREARYHVLRDGLDADAMPWPELWLFEGRLEGASE